MYGHHRRPWRGGDRNAGPSKAQEEVQRIDGAVVKAHGDIIAAGESVTAWKVSQSAVIILQAASWESLGFPMQHIPSLYRIIVTEGKVNSFIHCFVGVQNVTSLYDLERAICESEGIQQFEELGLGPLLKHPLVKHYFSVGSDVMEVLKISTSEIISHLGSLLWKRKKVEIDELLDLIAKRKKQSRDTLCIRIRSLRMHIGHILKARRSESLSLKEGLAGVEEKLEHEYNEDEDADNPQHDDKKEHNGAQNTDNISLRNISSDSSKAEGAPRIWLDTEMDNRFHSQDGVTCDGQHIPSKGEERAETKSCSHSIFHERANKMPDESKVLRDNIGKGYQDKSEIDFRTKMFIKKWREACRNKNLTKVYDLMMEFYHSKMSMKKRMNKAKHMLSEHPNVELLNVAVASIKFGFLDTMNDMSQAFNQQETEMTVSEKCARNINVEVEPSEKDIQAANKMPNGIKNMSDDMEKEVRVKNGVDYHTNMFIKIWRETCRNKHAAEVYNLMIEFYHKNMSPKTRMKKVKRMLSSDPNAGLLNVAVASIKLGFWVITDDMSQAFSNREIDMTSSETYAHNANVVAETSKKDVQVARKHILEHQHGVAVEDILKNVSAYFELYDHVQDDESRPEEKLIILRKLCMCQSWLTEQFSVTDFESLGYGDFFLFLNKHVSLLPHMYQKFFLTTMSREKPSVEVCMSQTHLLEFLLQASNSLGDHKLLTKHKVSELLTMQYPSAGLTFVENDPAKDFLDTVGGNKSYVSSNRVLFSSALSALHYEKGFSGSHVTTKDALQVLLGAPMLIDLESWSYWDLKFAPSLGPLASWLLNEVKTNELQCLVTREGKVLRIDHTATVDSFLEVSLQGSSFRSAVQLLSIFALYGGERHVPLSLLKCHAKKAFEFIMKCYMDNELNDGQRYIVSDLKKSKRDNIEPVHVASIFILDCLGYLPKEFRYFAAELLLSGFREIVKDAYSVILSECRDKSDHLMLHELGLLLGIVEWIGDHCTFCSSKSPKSSEYDKGIDTSYSSSSQNEVIISDEKFHGKFALPNRVDDSADCHIQCLPQHDKEKYLASVIESIRCEEFGLDPNLSDAEIRILKKQHARLGRALHCLSQELYSQDSHFLLELVQNADDNMYPRNVEPTLTFILQEGGIVVLNNEQGFSVENIRALCDVGNSTKKASNAGYIGKKGIGFKSVFRITDAPEIHSNGFHVKFDLSEGQIGFVLPTNVPPCDIEFFSNLVSGDIDQVDSYNWNTCILLPFQSKLKEISAVENIISMFADLHPSLLLFLHRLECIIFKNMLTDSLIIMRKDIIKDGIVNVSFGSKKLTWFVDSRKLRADAIRHDVQTTEISIAFALEESSDGSYIPKLDPQHVFAFLPLRAYGLKFIIQGDFVLPSSREEVDADSPWNQWLLSEFPSLFVNSEISFCKLPGFRDNPGKGVSAFMSFVPLVGEVHGFFSSLPRMIMSKLCTSNCLLLEGSINEWVPPCKVLRNWTEQVRTLLPDSLLRDHLGLGYLHKDIVLSDSLSRALGIEEYGPEILVQIMSSICCTQGGVRTMGINWLSSWLNSLYDMSNQFSIQSSLNSGSGSDIMRSLRKLPFIPLLDGKYGSIDEDTIWLNEDALRSGVADEYGLETFANLFSNLRIVSPALFCGSVVENLTRMLYKVGVRRLSAHDVVKMHVLPAISDEKNTRGSKDLMMEYLSFIMLHMQASCSNCSEERDYIISEVHNKAFVLTNYGFVRPVEVAIHFSKDFGNPIDMMRLMKASNMKWHEIDVSYLRYPVDKSTTLSRVLLMWRKFLQEVGVTDFVQIRQVERTVPITSQFILYDMMWEKEIISPGSIVKDWDSQELVHLLSEVSSSSDRERCTYLLEVLDTIWDDCFRGKVAAYCDTSGEGKLFKSSLLCALNDFHWITSTVDNSLCYPKDLFLDCESVRSILGNIAPYAVPQVQSKKLVNDIGFKTTVTLGDALSVLEIWKRCETPSKTSIVHMSRFYSFIRDELASSSQKIVEYLQSGAFIFVPYPSSSSCEVVPGVFLAPQEVYWRDHTGSMEQIRENLPQCNINDSQPLNKMLCHLYPGLHDFFVNYCGVNENPPLLDYIKIMHQLRTVNTPSQAAKRVFQVFLEWSEGLKSGAMSSEDVETIKVNLEKKEFKILPTVQDKWVSLHPSFGLVCWCDNEKLIGEFDGLHNIDFFSLCELRDEEKQLLQANVSILMQRLGIPALSELVTREAIYYGTADSSFETSLVRWVLPYAQRYIFNAQPNRYLQLKLSGFDDIKCLQIVVVETLFYRNVIKRPRSLASKKRQECSCLLQGGVLYITRGSDSHTIFLELSRFLVDGNHELPLANFLHLITTMAESGSTEEQIDTFILNSQKMQKLPDQEPVWSLQSKPSSAENEGAPVTPHILKMIHNPKTSKGQKRSGANWPPVSWATAPRSSSPQTNILKTQMTATLTDPKASSEANTDWIIEDHFISTEPTVNSQNSDDSVMNVESDSIEPASTSSSHREQLSYGIAKQQQASHTGRLGEEAAFNYYSRKHGETLVKWENASKETGLPYDIVISDAQGENQEYVEVKATESAKKDWFEISAREWQFAVEKGESFSIARVLLFKNKSARVTIYNNPVGLCRQGKLQLAIVVPKQQEEDSMLVS